MNAYYIVTVYVNVGAWLTWIWNAGQWQAVDDCCWTCRQTVKTTEWNISKVWIPRSSSHHQILLHDNLQQAVLLSWWSRFYFPQSNGSYIIPFPKTYEFFPFSYSHLYFNSMLFKIKVGNVVNNTIEQKLGETAQSNNIFVST